MSVAVRPAGEQDLEALVALNRLVQTLHATLYPDIFRSDIDDATTRTFFVERMARPANTVAIAAAGSDPLGYVWFERQARPQTPFTLPRRRIYVHHIAVAPAARRRGIGTALLRFVETRAEAEGIAEIALDTWSANGEAQTFFSKQGFAASNVLLRKIVG